MWYRYTLWCDVQIKQFQNTLHPHDDPHLTPWRKFTQKILIKAKFRPKRKFCPTWKAGPCSETKNGINTPISLSAAGKSCLKLLKWEYCHSGKFAIQIFPIINDCQRIFLAWGLELNINVYCGCQKHSPFHFFLQIPVIFQSQFLNFGPCLEPMMLLKIFKRQFL